MGEAGQITAIGKRLLRWGSMVVLSCYCLAASAQASEASLRVAFVYNFIKFIEWPELPDGELSLCVLGAQEDTRAALTPIDNKVLQNRHIRVTYINQLPLTDDAAIVQELNHCELLYVTEAGGDMPFPQILQPGQLVVMDEADPDDGRVSIALMRTPDNRIEFMVNETAVSRAGVKISSQLLKLAKKWKRGRG